MDCVVFLGDDEGTTYPRLATSGGKNTNLEEPIEFGFELWYLRSRDWVSSAIMWRNAFMNVEMYQFVRVMSENSLNMEVWFLRTL